MTTVFKVKNLRLKGALKQIKELYKETDTNIVLDFSSMKLVRSGGMIIFLSAIENMRKNGKHFIVNKNAPCFNDDGKYHACSYCKLIGFFKALGFEIGNELEFSTNSNRYFPITVITWKDLYNIDMSEYHNGITHYSEKLSKVLTSDINQFEPVVKYLITEIIRNSFEHTDTESVYVTAQRHPQEGTIEVAIADNAQGIKQVLSVNDDLNNYINSDLDALEYAIKPGISGNAKFQKDKNYYWANSGYGLYVTSEILKIIGNFNLISGNAMLEIENGVENSFLDIDYKGTAVILQINIEKVKNIDKYIIHDIVKKGERLASSDTKSIHKASKSSRME